MTKAENSRVAQSKPSADRIAADIKNFSPSVAKRTVTGGGGVIPAAPLRLISMFSGIGGFEIGLERSGAFEAVAVAEMDAYASKVLALRFPDVPNLGDVTKADYPDADAICAGFPCQDISYAGAGAGLAGARSGLFWEVVRAISVVRPSVVILENVAALLSRGLDTVLRALAEIGYDAEWHCIPASAVGAHHRRDRIWIIAHPRGEQHEGCRTPISGEIAAELFGAASDTTTVFGTSVFGCQQNRDHASAGEMADAAGERWGQGDTNAGRCSEGSVEKQGAGPGGDGWWAAEPALGRVAHGVPPELDGGLNAQELDQASSTEGVPSAGTLPMLWRDREAGATPPVIQGAGAGRDTLPAVPCESGPEGWTSAREIDASLCAVRNGVSSDAQHEAPAVQPGMPFGDGKDQRREALGLFWAQEPADTPRVAHGVKNRVDRLRCLGNAIVPQVAEVIGRAIARHRATSMERAA